MEELALPSPETGAGSFEQLDTLAYDGERALALAMLEGAATADQPAASVDDTLAIDTVMAEVAAVMSVIAQEYTEPAARRAPLNSSAERTADILKFPTKLQIPITSREDRGGCVIIAFPPRCAS